MLLQSKWPRRRRRSKEEGRRRGELSSSPSPLPLATRSVSRERERKARLFNATSLFKRDPLPTLKPHRRYYHERPQKTTSRKWLLAAVALAAVVLALAVAPAAAAPAKQAEASAVEQYTALAKEYVAKAQKLAEDITAQAQAQVRTTTTRRSCLFVCSPSFAAAAAARPSRARSLPLLPAPPLLLLPNKKQAEQYIKQANDLVQDTIKQITAKKTEL